MLALDCTLREREDHKEEEVAEEKEERGMELGGGEEQMNKLVCLFV